MKQLFGEFLVEKGIVNEGALVNALIEQLRGMPSLAEIAHELDVLSPGQVFAALTKQTKSQVDFRSACIDLGFWSDEVQTKIETTIRNRRKPIGQLLVNSGAVEFKKLTEALDEYLISCEEKPGTATSPVVAPAEFKTESDAPAAALAAAPGTETATEESGEFPIIGVGVISDYADLLNESIKSELVGAVQSWVALATSIGDDENQKQKLLNSLKETFNILHSIKGSARFIRAHLSERIVAEAENVIAPLQAKLEEGTTPAFDEIAPALACVIDHVWELRGTIEASGSEQAFWADESSKSGYLETIKAIVALKSK